MAISSAEIKAKEGELGAILDEFDAVGRTIPALQESADKAAAALKQANDSMSQVKQRVMTKLREIMAIYQDVIDRNSDPVQPADEDPVMVPSASDLQPQV